MFNLVSFTIMPSKLLQLKRVFFINLLNLFKLYPKDTTMKTIITILLTIFTLNANALEFIGSDKHLECAQKVAVALDIQDADYRIYMMDELMSKKTHAYVSETNVPNTIAFVINKSKRAGKV